MVKLYGQDLSRRETTARLGRLSQVAGVRLMTLGDGVERGVRMLEFRTGTGLRFTVMIDRGFDIGDCEQSGRAIGWHSPAGFPHPGLADPEAEGGLGWLRAASGLLVTCGLDQILSGGDTDAAHFNYGPRQTVRTTLHGRVSMVPARLTGYGERWDGDDCTLWCEGIVQQSALFAENLVLVRRIEAPVGSDEIRIHDRVVNEGFSPTPHMYLYHINLGYPLLDAGTRYIAPVAETIWAVHAGEGYRTQGVGYQRAGAPQPAFREQVWQHDMTPDGTGRVRVAVINDRSTLGVEVETRLDQFPCHFQWQNFRAGHYALGIEPATNHVHGRKFAQERGELIWLEHGEGRHYDTTLRIFSSQEDLDGAEARVRAVAPLAEEDYPTPSANYRTL